ncbi:unnamed protein product [Caenorhabditis sp. 36 PRJEB53466]|nr:unnamed protein product [Caenorhabditis sp. 36 PRJEB53466]
MPRARLEFVVFLLYLSRAEAIISPPNEIVEELADVFSEWRNTRKEFMDSMKHPMGLPHFNCSLPSLSPPASVHQLHPSQIDVVAALGDSVSVAQAAESSSVFDLLRMYPGVSFVTGADVELKEQATLINMFRQFSPRAKGGSSDKIQKFYDFNFAVPGSFSYELPEQAEKLARTFEHRLGEANLKSWKFVNVFMGHNDLCRICINQSLYGPETFGKSLRTALSVIKSKVPNVFVNIMPPINVQIHTQDHNVSKFCEFSHKKTCPCIFELDKQEYLTIKQKFDEQLRQVVGEFTANSTDPETFTVVVAPAMDLQSIPLLNGRTNVGLLALDCFHLSPITHDIAAKQIWKGLFEKVGEKSVTSQVSAGFDRFVCPPTECPYLRTSVNSANCVPPKELRLLLTPSADVSSYNWTLFPLLGFFIAGTTLILLFVRASFRRPSSEFCNERRRLLLPMRADLNDNIF